MIEQTMQARPSISSPVLSLLRSQRMAEIRTASAHTDEIKTQGEIEAAVCKGLRRFEQDYLGRGPKDIHAHLLGDLLVIRLTGVLTAAEQHLAQSQPAEKGRVLLKQVRTHLVETARPILEEMVHEVTGVQVQSLHHDISTVAGEEIIVFSLAAPPRCREAKRR